LADLDRSDVRIGGDMIKGTPVSSGIAQGTAFVVACSDSLAAALRSISPEEVAPELARFERAVDLAEAELLALKEQVDAKVGSSEADIFTAQMLVLRDPLFHGQVRRIVEEKRVNVESAISEVLDSFIRTFEKIPDPYLRERAADVRDVGRRVLATVSGGPGRDFLEVPEGAIVVSEELLPSATAHLELNNVRGFVTEKGGKFSHTAILARSMGTPAVAGVADAATRVKTGDQLIVDGIAGVVYVNPNERVRSEYRRLESEVRAYRQELRQLINQPAVTLDGTPIALYANVSKLSDTEAALLYNADGIGLYRTEFGFSVRPAFPTVEEQYEYLKRVAERLHPRRVVLRLLDLGGDKELPYFPLPRSRNPSLSDRGIRLLLKHPQILRDQLCAFLRVSGEHPVSVLLPVVGGAEDVRRVRAMIREIQAELAADGQRFDPNLPVGAMIEVPAAALIAESLAREVDFFSLGTNDLVQYLLAADREDEQVSSYYQPLHPAVLQLLSSMAGVSRRTGRKLTLCGEMAGQAEYTELLLGLGLRELSVAPGELLDVKNAIRKTDLDQATALAQQALTLSSAQEVEALLQSRRPTPHLEARAESPSSSTAP
jgi:phosphoenolpyruvate-protein phosphotransferase (PTS system enzyme I)